MHEEILVQGHVDAIAWERREAEAASAGHVDDAAIEGRLPSSCVEYLKLVRRLEDVEPTEADFRALAEHEASCPSGLHSEYGVERALGLPEGSLRNGSLEHELRSPREVIDDLIDRHLSESERLAALVDQED